MKEFFWVLFLSFAKVKIELDNFLMHLSARQFYDLVCYLVIIVFSILIISNIKTCINEY
jgi:hypothetical protein